MARDHIKVDKRKKRKKSIRLIRFSFKGIFRLYLGSFGSSFIVFPVAIVY